MSALHMQNEQKGMRPVFQCRQPKKPAPRFRGLSLAVHRWRMTDRPPWVSVSGHPDGAPRADGEKGWGKEHHSRGCGGRWGWAGRKLLCGGGGGGGTAAHLPNPPSPSLAAVPGVGVRAGTALPAVPRGGGGGGGTAAHLPNPPPPSLVAVPGVGVRAGTALPAVPRGGGGGWHGSPFAQPPPSLLGRRAGSGGSGRDCPTCRAPGGGGGSAPTHVAQKDPHVALIILTTRGGGGGVSVKKTFPGQNLWSGAFGGNIRPYRKQRARHGSPFLEPPLLRQTPMPSPPPTRQSTFRVALEVQGGPPQLVLNFGRRRDFEMELGPGGRRKPSAGRKAQKKIPSA